MITHRPASGIPSYDSSALFSAPTPRFQETCLLPDGLALMVQPRLPHVKTIEVTDQSADAAIWIVEGVTLDAYPSKDLPIRTLNKDSLLLLPRHMSTTWHSPQGQPEVVHLHLTQAFRERWCDEEGLRHKDLMPIANCADKAIGEHFLRARKALSSDGPFRTLRVQAAALEVAHHCLILGHGAAAGRRTSNAMTPARMRRVRSYVEEHIASDVSIEAMAGCVGLSASHFSRAFRAEMGVSPYAWVLMRRVERVKSLLRSGRRDLAALALECGFASQSHMTETFRKLEGVPPVRWRRERC